MNLLTAAALLYLLLTLIIVGFQLALAAGAPWGDLAMGGRYPGQFPAQMRVGAVIQAGLLAALALIVLARAGLVLPEWSGAGALVWIAVGLSVISLVLNLITPSKWERRLWAPVALLMLISSLLVALN
jgi:hypothetical protein